MFGSMVHRPSANHVGCDEDYDEKGLIPVTHKRSRLQRMMIRVPPFLLLPLICMVIVAFVLPIMIPVYVIFERTNSGQEHPLVWPLERTVSEVVDAEDIISVEVRSWVTGWGCGVVPARDLWILLYV